VRRERHAIDAQQRAGHGVHRRGDGRDVVQRAEDVGDVRDGDELGARRQQRLEVGDAQLRVVVGRRHAPPLDGEVEARGDVHPRRAVRFVVERAQHQLVARCEVQRRRQVAEQLRCCGSDNDLAWRCVDVLGGRFIACVVQIRGFAPDGV